MYADIQLFPVSQLSPEPCTHTVSFLLHPVSCILNHLYKQTAVCCTLFTDSQLSYPVWRQPVISWTMYADHQVSSEPCTHTSCMQTVSCNLDHVSRQPSISWTLFANSQLSPAPCMHTSICLLHPLCRQPAVFCTTWSKFADTTHGTPSTQHVFFTPLHTSSTCPLHPPSPSLIFPLNSPACVQRYQLSPAIHPSFCLPTALPLLPVTAFCSFLFCSTEKLHFLQPQNYNYNSLKK